MKKLSGTSQKANIGRILDANLNRAKEGLRVCEEITRFVLNQHEITATFKALRHRVNILSARFYPRGILLKHRQPQSDVGRLNSRGELKRANLADVFFANIQRVKESLRVLEEFSKLSDKRNALGFKALRYQVYALEKEAFKKISALSDLR